MREAIEALAEGLDAGNHDPRGFILHQRGRRIASCVWRPCSLYRPQQLFSLSKSFTSIAAGYLVEDGRLGLDDRVIRFFPGDRPAEISDRLAKLTVRNLLTMATGQKGDGFWDIQQDPDGNWPRGFMRREFDVDPGTRFLYDTGSTYMVGAIVQRLTGQRVTDFLRPRLIDPLGIKFYWSETDPKGRDHAGTGMRIALAELAKVAEAIRTRNPILPNDYLKLATSKQIDNGPDPNNDWNQGYGFQFWQCRHGAFRGDGAFGQFMLFFPQHEATLVMFNSSNDLQGILNLVYQHALPMLESGYEGAPVLLDREVTTRGLTPMTRPPSEPWMGSWEFGANEAGIERLEIGRQNELWRVRIVAHGQESVILTDGSTWRENTVTGTLPEVEPAFARIGMAGDRLALRLRFPEMTQLQFLDVSLSGPRAEVEFRAHGRFSQGEFPKITSK